LKRSARLDSGKKGPGVDANTQRVVSAFVLGGVGLQTTNAVLLALNMEPLCESTWSSHTARVAEAASGSMRETLATHLRAEITATLLYEGEDAIGPDGKVYVRVVTDGSWQKRYGRNSLWGYAVMYGFYTGKVVFVSHRCGRCAKCQSALTRGVPVEEHECTNNWSGGAAGNMEKDILLEGVNFLFDAGAIVRSLVCDGDTKGIELIKKEGPKEVAEVIEAMLDLNHISKNLGKKLRELKVISKVQAQALQKAFSSAVYWAREKCPKEQMVGGESWEEGPAKMQRMIRAVLGHYFNLDNHSECEDTCAAKCGDKKHTPGNLKKYIPCGKETATDVFDAVKSIFDQYSSLTLCSKLLFKCSTNTCESGNSVLWTFHLPKLAFKPTMGKTHMHIAQLHKAFSRGAAGLLVSEGIGGLWRSGRNLEETRRIDKHKQR